MTNKNKCKCALTDTEILAMSEEHSNDNNKNTSMYDEYLIQVKKQHNVGAKITLQRLYELLKLEDPRMSNDDIYDRIMKDCLEIWQKQTIRNNMPDELKDQERQETGKKGAEKKKEITVTASGSVATESVANNSPESPTEPKLSRERKLSPIEMLATVKADAEPNKFVPEDPQIEELQLENGKLKETVEEKNKEIKEMVIALNLANKKDKKIEESAEYQTLKSQLLIAEQERDEYKQVATKNMKEHPEQTFQTATQMQPVSNEITTITTTTIPNEVEFPAKELITFRMDVNAAKPFWAEAKDAKKVMYLTIQSNQVTGWESDYTREKKQRGRQ